MCTMELSFFAAPVIGTHYPVGYFIIFQFNGSYTCHIHTIILVAAPCTWDQYSIGFIFLTFLNFFYIYIYTFWFIYTNIYTTFSKRLNTKAYWVLIPAAQCCNKYYSVNIAYVASINRNIVKSHS